MKIMKVRLRFNAKRAAEPVGTATLAKVNIYFFFLTSFSFFSAAFMIICMVFSLA